jgi:hypothetical protein
MLHRPNPANAVQALDSLLRLFGENGEHWTRLILHDGEGKHCLVGAIDDLYRKQAAPRGTRRGVGFYIGAVFGPHRLLSRAALITFNDLCKSFDEFRAVILKARAMAQRDMERQQPEIAAPPKRRPTPKPPADRQRHSAVIHADRAVPALETIISA